MVASTIEALSTPGRLEQSANDKSARPSIDHYDEVEDGGQSSDQENETPPQPTATMWKHSASKAADNLIRILQDIELDVTITEDIKDTVKNLRGFDGTTKPRGGTQSLHPKSVLAVSSDTPTKTSNVNVLSPRSHANTIANAASSSVEKVRRGGGRMQRMVLERQRKMMRNGVHRSYSVSSEEESATREMSMTKPSPSKLVKDIESKHGEPEPVAKSIAIAEEARDENDQTATQAEGTSTAEKELEDTKDIEAEEGEGIFFQKTDLAALQNNIRNSLTKAKSAVSELKIELEKQTAEAEAERIREEAEQAEKMRQAAEEEEAQRKQEEADRIAEEQRIAEEARRKQEEANRIEAEQRRIAEAKRVVEEEQREAEAEQKREAERLAEEQRLKKEKIQLVEMVLRESQNEKDSYYKALGLDSTASENDIKKSYRKLALKLHPDKDRYDTPNCDEAFKAIAHAYDVLKDAAQRRAYDQMQNTPDISTTTTDATAAPTTSGATGPFDVIPNAAVITVQSIDPRFSHLNGTKGSIVGYDPVLDLYSIRLDNSGKIVMSKATALFQCAPVCLRAHQAHKLGVFVVTMASYWQDAKSYQARYTDSYGRTMMTTLRPEQFIVPTGTVVRLEGLQNEQSLNYNGQYGTVMDWKERYDEWGCDTSYYEVQLSQAVSVRVKMANVCL